MSLRQTGSCFDTAELEREYAGLDREIVLVGVLDHFEIWSRENWDRENAYLEKDMKKEDVRNEIAKLGL